MSAIDTLQRVSPKKVAFKSASIYERKLNRLKRILFVFRDRQSPVIAEMDDSDDVQTGAEALNENVMMVIYFLLIICASLIFVGIARLLSPQIIPFSPMSFWQMRGSVTEWLWSARWLFAWGTGFTALVSFLTYNKVSTNRYAERILTFGTISSFRAGIFEEITYRWALFFAFIVLVKIAGWFTLIRWIYLCIIATADFFTFSYVHDMLYSHGWFIGAAIISANASFRDGHKYQGFVGLVNSWYIGMFLFKLMFAFGLIPVILIHLLYDVFIHIVRYIDMAIERAQGRV